MSFSYDVKEELSNFKSFNDKNQIKYELIGYLISNNSEYVDNKIKFSTESSYNINRFAKLIGNLKIDDFDINIIGKIYFIELFNWNFINEIVINNNKILIKNNYEKNELNDKALVRGAFLGSGYINDPSKKYHLEMKFSEKENMKYILNVLNQYNFNFKIMKNEKNYMIYIKDGEEISNFLAFIGASKGVLKFEENRVIHDTRNNMNRMINCETANFAKVIKAGQKQIDDINFIKSKNKFNDLPDNLKIVAKKRLENPEASLSELVNLLDNTISKSGVSHRLSAISKFADELRDDEK